MSVDAPTTTPITTPPSQTKKQRKWLFAAVLFLLLVFVVLILMEDTADVSQRELDVVRPEVSVVSVTPGSHSGYIEAFAEITPRWQTVLSAQVDGEIITMSPLTLVGQRVAKGDLLLAIESREYQAQLHEAQEALAQAQLQFLQEQKRAQLAYDDWQLSGMEGQPTSLALNKPQLDLAKKSVAAAEARIKAAQQQLNYTQVRAPFSGYVRQRQVSLGQTIAAGEPLLELIGDGVQDITVALTEQQWRLLGVASEFNESKLVANLYADNDDLIATAVVQRGGAYVDPETRQYQLHLTVDTAESHLPSGLFVQVRLPTLPATQSLSVPAGSLTQDGNVWYVDDDERLQRFTADLLFYHQGRPIVAAPDTTVTTWRIATLPLASFLPGLAVTAKEIVR